MKKKEHGMSLFELLMINALLIIAFYYVIVGTAKNMANHASALIPVQEFHIDSASQKLKVKLKNTHKRKVRDLRVVCDITMKSGTNLSGVQTLFDSVSQNETKTLEISSFQYMTSPGDEINYATYETIPNADIAKISSCRIVQFKEID